MFLILQPQYNCLGAYDISWVLNSSKVLQDTLPLFFHEILHYFQKKILLIFLISI